MYGVQSISMLDQEYRAVQAQKGWYGRQDHGVGRLMENQADREG